jgi:hypothetical protein
VTVSTETLNINTCSKIFPYLFYRIKSIIIKISRLANTRSSRKICPTLGHLNSFNNKMCLHITTPVHICIWMCGPLASRYGLCGSPVSWRWLALKISYAVGLKIRCLSKDENPRHNKPCSMPEFSCFFTLVSLSQNTHCRNYKKIVLEPQRKPHREECYSYEDQLQR